MMKELLENFVLNEELFPLPSRGEKKRYLIQKTEDWELILMVWGREAQTPIHDHGGSRCWTRLLKGNVSEKLFLKDQLILLSQTDFRLNEVTYVDEDEGIHQLINSGQTMAFTLHLYMKPLTFCNVFDDQIKTWGVLENYYDSFEGFSR